MTQTETNLSRVRDALKSGARLTVVSALRICHTSELRHYVCELKKEGLNIKSKWIRKKDKNFKVYWLEKLEVSN